VLVHLYEDHGLGFVDRLEGMFAFALWDARERRLVLGRDRFGIKPLYVATNRHGDVLFCSEIKGLLQCEVVERSIDHQSLDMYFTYQFIPAPNTIYEGVRKLPAATVAVVDESGRLTAETYWRLEGSEERLGPGSAPAHSRTSCAGNGRTRPPT
jgi:asparagine synthase (glutamine-hydrolysing)